MECSTLNAGMLKDRFAESQELQNEPDMLSGPNLSETNIFASAVEIMQTAEKKTQGDSMGERNSSGDKNNSRLQSAEKIVKLISNGLIIGKAIPNLVNMNQRHRNQTLD